MIITIVLWSCRYIYTKMQKEERNEERRKKIWRDINSKRWKQKLYLKSMFYVQCSTFEVRLHVFRWFSSWYSNDDWQNCVKCNSFFALLPSIWFRFYFSTVLSLSLSTPFALMEDCGVDCGSYIGSWILDAMYASLFTSITSFTCLSN